MRKIFIEPHGQRVGWRVLCFILAGWPLAQGIS